jgi:hypothetical protein
MDAGIEIDISFDPKLKFQRALENVVTFAVFVKLANVIVRIIPGVVIASVVTAIVVTLYDVAVPSAINISGIVIVAPLFVIVFNCTSIPDIIEKP